MTKLFDLKTLKESQILQYWEEAYQRFETPEQEVKKFLKRFHFLGQKNWKRDLQIVDIFSGRCNGIRALEKLGFANLEGVDISENLLSKYTGSAKLYEADCRKLPFDNESRDLIVVQGGLHHLPALPEDVEQTLKEVARVLRPDGRFVMLEPWETLFLRISHFLSRQKLVRLLSPRFDAFASLNHYESKTYYNWLSRKQEILNLLEKYFDRELLDMSWAKIKFVGTKKKVA